MINLSIATKSIIEKKTGLTAQQIKTMSPEELDQHLGGRMHKEMRVNLPQSLRLRRVSRGSVYLSLGRLADRLKETNIKLSKI